MKYQLTDNTKRIGNITLYQIKALRDILCYGVKAGDLGGWVEKESNLSQEGDAWVSGDAWVYGNAWVYCDAWVSQGKYTTRVLSISTYPYQITAIYPNHVQIGCHLFEICEPEKAIQTMFYNQIDERYHKQILIAVELCKQWLSDNPEPHIDEVRDV